MGICGPDVSNQLIEVWSQIQKDFATWSDVQKDAACNRIVYPIKPKSDPNNKAAWDDMRKKAAEALHHPFTGESWQNLVKSTHGIADINGWDVLPLYQGNSDWLRTPPVFDKATNGPCATPSSSDYYNSSPFADGHEDPATCSNTVNVGGKCWLNGTVNYGTFGIMLKLCDGFRAKQVLEGKRSVLEMSALSIGLGLIYAYKKFGPNPEGYKLPIAWTKATYFGGPKGVPNEPGNRPNCDCTCTCSASDVNWNYVWEPIKRRIDAVPPILEL
jgi:hypothetical protein